MSINNMLTDAQIWHLQPRLFTLAPVSNSLPSICTLQLAKDEIQSYNFAATKKQYSIVTKVEKSCKNWQELQVCLVLSPLWYFYPAYSLYNLQVAHMQNKCKIQYIDADKSVGYGLLYITFLYLRIYREQPDIVSQTLPFYTTWLPINLLSYHQWCNKGRATVGNAYLVKLGRENKLFRKEIKKEIFQVFFDASFNNFISAGLYSQMVT